MHEVMVSLIAGPHLWGPLGQHLMHTNYNLSQVSENWNGSDQL